MQRRFFSLGTLIFTSLLAGCGDGSDDEDDYQYEKADVEASLFGSWSGTWSPAAGEPSTFELEIRAPDAPPLSSNCGQRTLGSVSPQCYSTSSMAISATVTLAEAGSSPVDLDGSIFVPGLVLSEAYVDLAREGAPFSLAAQWTESGWSMCRAQTNGATVAECSIAPR